MGNWGVVEWSLAVLTGLATLLMYISQVGPKQAISHTAEWLSAVGLKKVGVWLDSAQTDRIVRHVAAFVILWSLSIIAAQTFDFASMHAASKILGVGGVIAIAIAIVINATQTKPSAHPSGVPSTAPVSNTAKPPAAIPPVSQTKRIFMRSERNAAITSIVAAQELLKETTKETLDSGEAVLSEMQKDGSLDGRKIDERIKAFESSLQKQTGAMASFRYDPKHHDLNLFGIDMSWNNDTHSMQVQVQMADAEFRRYLGEVKNRFGSLEWRYIQDSVNLQTWKDGALGKVRGWAYGHDGNLQKARERWENAEVAD